jgi:hypothetical protein
VNLEKGGAALSFRAGAYLYPAPQDVVIIQRCSDGARAALRPYGGTFYAESCIRTSENSPTRQVGELRLTLACQVRGNDA